MPYDQVKLLIDNINLFQDLKAETKPARMPAGESFSSWTAAVCFALNELFNLFAFRNATLTNQYLHGLIVLANIATRSEKINYSNKNFKTKNLKINFFL